MKRRFLVPLLASLPALLLASDAAAVRSPDGFSERPLEPMVGRARRDLPASWAVPPAARRSWQQLTAAHGAWRAVWDLDRGVPLRVFGQGIAFPGASTKADVAEAAARHTLAAQLPLLAPGTLVDDWVLVSNVVHGRDGAMRSVGFVQRHAGLAVLGGQVGFLFKRDRLIVMSSAAFPGLKLSPPGRLAADVTTAAVAWIEALYGATPELLSVGDVVILPVVRERDDGQPVIEHRTVRTVVLDLAAPRARWDVYVDATTGLPVARAQTLMFGTGTLRFDAPVRYPAGGRMDYVAPGVAIDVDAAPRTTAADGSFSFAGAGPASVTASVSGSLVRVTSNGAAGATQIVSVPDGGSGTWSAAAQGPIDAQLSGFIHGDLVKRFAKTELAPQLDWLDGQLDVVVNEVGSCNAYSTGDDIHFFAAGDGCENTARLADVVYHEFGHSLHRNTVITGVGIFDSHMSEGVSDYLAATITGDPGMGRGFLTGDSQALRDLDPDGREARYPEDMDDDPHMSGLIIGGALWDLRQDFISQLGPDAGKRAADDLYYALLARGTEIPSAYVEVLAADDDDGNLDNGTPNKCTIDRAFAAHGLVDPALAIGALPPTRDDFTVTVSRALRPGACPEAAVESAVISWRLAGETASQQITMAPGADALTAAIPEQAVDAVVQYQVTVTLAGGARFVYPLNQADPWYQFHVGPLVPVYCTDFEADPFAAGWSHSANAGNSEWAWGVPETTPRSGDPAAAHSGNRVVGMDLGGGRDGVYEPGSSTTLSSPVIDVSGRQGVRLVYRRWLNVEDGFYDDATILADGEPLWGNFASGDQQAGVNHLDLEWRAHDVDLAAQAADGSVQVSFRLEADGGLELGGWTIDDFCIMARGTGDPCLDEGICPEVDDGGCCSTGGNPAGPIALGCLTALFALRRRRRGNA